MAGSLFEENPGTFSLSLSQLTGRIGQMVNSHPELTGVWVRAELSDVRVNGGHCYMELVEKNPQGQTVAKLKATIWAQLFARIRQQFLYETGMEITTGMKVLLQGNANHHSLYGLSFNVTRIDPSFSLGDIEKNRREILERLAREGIINRNKQQYLCPVPQRIAVISAAGAAGYGDFINQLNGNAQGFVFYPCLVPAVMQGDRVAESVCRALDFIEQRIDAWDCVAIVRGGGATTDLIGFDNYMLARRVAEFVLPVIVGIGHERDRTVLDEIAHTRVKTPTAAAAFFVQKAAEAYEKVLGSVNFISRYATASINGEKTRLAHLTATIPALANARIANARMALDRELARIPVMVDAKISQNRVRLDNFAASLQSSAKIILENNRREQQRISENLITASQRILEKEKLQLDSKLSLINILSPENTLKRGFAVVRKNGAALTATDNLSTGDIVKIKLYNGEAEAEVKGINP